MSFKLLFTFGLLVLLIRIDGSPINLVDDIPNKDPNLFEGDIEGVEINTKGVAIKPTQSRVKWPGGVVPYVFDAASDYTDAQKEVVYKGMRMVEDLTRIGNRDCIRFVPRTNEATYVRIWSGTGCSSGVGKQTASGPQNLSLKKPGNGGHCVWDYIVAHEFIHALGFYHEQSRPDRDDYVEIMWDNIPSDRQHNFNKYTTSVDTLGFPYDLYSIMHYDAYDFSNNGQPTIVSKDPNVDLTTFKHNFMTEIDIGELRKYYECS